MGNQNSIVAENPKKFGWVRDIPDIRDRKLSFKSHNYTQIKSKIDLRSKFCKIYDQGNINSSVAISIGSVLNFDSKEQNIGNFDPSIIFIYFNERRSLGFYNIDCGSSIRNTLKIVNKLGVCKNDSWPYDINYFKTQPYTKCYEEAKMYKRIKYKKLNNGSLRDLKTCLSMGRPFVFGFSVYDSFKNPLIWNPKIDSMPIPNPNKERLIGGHVCVAVGYSDKRKSFIIRNSWGKEWGLDGHFFMPYKFIVSNQCDDFWTFQFDRNEDFIVEKESYVEKVIKLPKKETETKTETKNILIPIKENVNKTKCMIKDM